MQSYSLHTRHNIDKRVWSISSTSDGIETWSSERVLDKERGEVIEWVRRQQQQQQDNGSEITAPCSIHTPIKGWYLLIKSLSQEFKILQELASIQASSSTTSSSANDLVTKKRATYSDNAEGKGKGKGYVNLVPSRTNPSTDFKFRFAHLQSEHSVSGGGGDSSRNSTNLDNPGNNNAAANVNKRRSFVLVDTEGNGTPQQRSHPPTNTDMNTNMDVLGGPSTKERNDRLSANSVQHTAEKLTGQAASGHGSTVVTGQSVRQSSFLLRPIAHSAAKSLAAESSSSTGNGGYGSSSASTSTGAAASTVKRNNRLSLRGITGLFTPKDNSFELLWEDDKTGAYIPIIIYEDHPSMLRTETSGTLHIHETLIQSTFQCGGVATKAAGTAARAETRSKQSGQTTGDATPGALSFYPVTFFVTVAIAYLGFLEDQEAYKAASHG